MLSPIAAVSCAAIVGVAIVAYYYVTGFPYGGLRAWIDSDFPEIVHTPKTTWLTGFMYKHHGVDKFAQLNLPICLEYTEASNLGKFNVVDRFALSTDAKDVNGSHDKDLVNYDFGVTLELHHGGKVAVQELYKRISITEITPVIKDTACEQ